MPDAGSHDLWSLGNRASAVPFEAVDVDTGGRRGGTLMTRFPCDRRRQDPRHPTMMGPARAHLYADVQTRTQETHTLAATHIRVTLRRENLVYGRGRGREKRGGREAARISGVEQAYIAEAKGVFEGPMAERRDRASWVRRRRLRSFLSSLGQMFLSSKTGRAGVGSIGS